MVDSLSFDFSITTQDSNNINKVVFKDVDASNAKRNLNKSLPDSLASMPKDKEKKFVRLESHNNESNGQPNISLELEIYDDSPKLKQKKYQFHWGSIDTTLVQKNKNSIFKQAVDLSLAKFKDTFNKEPVLTSSKSGVVDSFECKIQHYRENELIKELNIKSKLKDGSVFSFSIKLSLIHI